MSFDMPQGNDRQFLTDVMRDMKLELSCLFAFGLSGVMLP